MKAGRKSGIISLAGSVLARRQVPVAVLIDSDSPEPRVIEEVQSSTEELIRFGASSSPLEVIAVVPSIEAWLFAAPEAISRAVGEKVTDELVTLGKRDPKGVLQMHAARSQRRWNFDDVLHQLDPHAVESIRALPEVSTLFEFLREMQKEDQAA